MELLPPRNNIELSWDKFKDILFIIADECIPKLVLNRKRKRAVWLSEDTVKMIKKKRRIFNKAKRSNSNLDLQHYKQQSQNNDKRRPPLSH